MSLTPETIAEMRRMMDGLPFEDWHALRLADLPRFNELQRRLVLESPALLAAAEENARLRAVLVVAEALLAMHASVHGVTMNLVTCSECEWWARSCCRTPSQEWRVVKIWQDQIYIGSNLQGGYRDFDAWVGPLHPPDVASPAGDDT